MSGPPMFLDRFREVSILHPALQMPDGAMLVSDEQNGAVYRISYRR